MSFEKWYRKEVEDACGELTYGRHSDTEHIKRVYINRKRYVADAWDHQQEKIEALRVQLAEAKHLLRYHSEIPMSSKVKDFLEEKEGEG